MRRNKLAIFAVLALVGLIGVMFMPKVEAFEVRETKNLAKDEVVNGDLFISGDSVRVEGTVNGNLFIAGSILDISGKVTGNVFAGGNTITISGEVGKSVYAGAANITISGDVARDVFIGAGQAIVSGKIGENLFAGVGTLNVNNAVNSNLYVGAGQVTVTGVVGGDAFISTSAADVNKELVKGKLELRIEEPKAAPKVDVDPKVARKVASGITSFAMFMKFVMFLGVFLMSLVVLKYFPTLSESIEQGITTNFGKSLAFGVLTLFAFPLILIFLLVSVIGIPFGMLLTGLIAGAGFLSTVWTGNIAGRYIMNALKVKEPNKVLSLFVGQVALAIICLIPLVGFFVKVLMHSVVLGSAAMSIENRKK